MTEDELAAAQRRFVGQVAHWTPARWSASSDMSGTTVPAETTRAEITHALIQRLADAAADAEGREHRPVPRLENDLVLPDQLTVMVDDLRAAPGADLPAAAEDILATRRLL